MNDKKEYIERGVLMYRLGYYYDHTSGDSNYAYGVALKEVRSAPAADVVEVVRCKDCKHLETVIDIIGDMYCFCGNANGKYITEVDLEDFCSHAEKREGAENG